jgi:hypothetical protein
MSSVRVSVGVLFAGLFVVSCYVGGAYLWGKTFGGTKPDAGQAVAFDADGNRFVAGSFRGSADFGGGALTSDGEDIFVAKYSPAGVLQWSKHFGSTGFNRAEGIALDRSGNVIVVGGFTGAVDFGGGPLSSAGGFDVFVAKFSAAGAHLWSRAFGNAQDDLAYAVAVDEGDDIVVTGTFYGRVDFGGGILTGWTRDTFVAKYTAFGEHVWSRNFSTGYGFSTGNGIATDGNGNVVVVGFLQAEVDFGAGPVTSAGAKDVFMAKYSPEGDYLWARTFGNTRDDVANGVAVSANDDIVITGSFYGPVDFGGGPLASDPSDVFVAKYSSTGAHEWSLSFGDLGADTGYGVAVDPSGNVVIAGEFRGTVDFGRGPITGPGNQDIFVAKYSPVGAPLWARAFGGDDNDGARAAAVDGAGNVLVTGIFAGEAFLGSDLVTSAGSTDVFLTELSR